MNRRYFLMGAASAVPAARATAAADKMNIAFVGVAGRGQYLQKIFCGLPDVNVSYVCDVDQRVIPAASKIVEDMKNVKPKVVSDIRRVLEDKSVDAVVMGTPIHWHAPGTILACDAGKDVYVEKPASHNIREGQLMVEAARRNKRIVQLGTQSRSRPVTQRFVEYVQSGKIGDVLMVKVWNVQGRGTPGALPSDEPVPAGLDYDTWTGPIPKLPFSRRRFGGATNMHWHYGTGDIGNDGIHWLDIGRWVLGVEKPVEISGMGGRIYLSGDEQTPPDTMNITYDYKGKLIFFEQRLWNPYRLEGSENTVAAYGTKGYAQVGRWNNGYHAFRVFDDKNRQIHFDQEERPDDHKHHINFIECIRSRKKPNADIETGHVSTLLVHLGNIVARTGRNIRFDGSTERVIDDEKANNYLTREYREHWSKPMGV